MTRGVKQAGRVGQAVLPGRNDPGHGSLRKVNLPGGQGLIHLYPEIPGAGNQDHVSRLIDTVHGKKHFLRMGGGGQNGAVGGPDKNSNHKTDSS